MLYSDTKIKVRSPDEDIGFFDIASGCSARKYIYPISIPNLPIIRFFERR